MILVCDSGSSKADWILAISSSEQLNFRTSGINPFFWSEKEISKTLSHNTDIKPYLDQVTEVYFFGAGCSSPDRREIVSNGLSNVFKNAFISVENDLVGSVYATCGNKAGLSCILGTGSNISFYDGSEIHAGKHGLGYILGDEGSGTYFGKKLITSYLYGTMPLDLSRDFYHKYELTKETVIHRVYQQEAPNFFLASFAKFLSDHMEHPYVTALLKEGFEEFVRTNIVSFPDYRKYPCHFVGSIAYHFQHILRDVCSSFGVQVGKVLKHPIEDLFSFIQNREDQTA